MKKNNMSASQVVAVMTAAMSASACPAYAADVVISPPAGGGVSITDSSGGSARLRVDDSGAVSVPGLPSAAQHGSVVCYGSGGVLGNCDPGAITGPQGPQGVAGAQGAQGVAGPQGTVGAQGATGAMGPAGVMGPQGAAGPQGVSGTVGAQGAQGNTGPGVLSGAADPAAGVGNDGDFYLNTATSTMFGPKSAGSWGAGFSLLGAQGIQGPQGAQGVQGAQGSVGAQGTTGAIGPAGPQGVQGAQGATGATGAQGPQGVQGSAGSYTAAAGSGLEISGSSIQVLKTGCSAGQVLQFDGTNWSCATPSGGGFTIRSTVNGAQGYSVDASCNPGEKAIGGSCYTSDTQGGVYGEAFLCGAALCSSGATAPTGWRCEYNSSKTNWQAFVFCQ